MVTEGGEGEGEVGGGWTALGLTVWTMTGMVGTIALARAGGRLNPPDLTGDAPEGLGAAAAAVADCIHQHCPCELHAA